MLSHLGEQLVLRRLNLRLPPREQLRPDILPPAHTRHDTTPR
jgi:hypothetical protein